MRATGILVLSSTGLIAAVWLVVVGWRTPRPRVDAAVRRLRRDAATASSGLRIGPLPLPTPVRRSVEARQLPLRLIGRSPERHVTLMLAGGLVGLAVPTLLAAALATTGTAATGWVIPAALSLATALIGAAVVHGDAMAKAAEIRVDLRYQLGAYVDMVTMLLAGNTGYEGALERAARAGDGRLFIELRRRMREVSATGRSMGDALTMVASDLGIVELDQVAATAALAASEGAPVARTLAAKCATLRSTLAGELEADARIRTDKVTPPLVGMALLFMALLIYPALNLN
ncbi:MAG: hypothetical protein AAGF73_00605 [Actinomycetota bacterium]